MIKVLFFFSAGLFFAQQTEAQVHFRSYPDKKEMFLQEESYQLCEEFDRWPTFRKTKTPVVALFIPGSAYQTTNLPETHAPGRVVPIWWILILALILLAAFFYKEHGNRKKK